MSKDKALVLESKSEILPSKGKVLILKSKSEILPTSSLFSDRIIIEPFPMDFAERLHIYDIKNFTLDQKPACKIKDEGCKTQNQTVKFPKQEAIENIIVNRLKKIENQEQSLIANRLKKRLKKIENQEQSLIVNRLKKIENQEQSLIANRLKKIENQEQSIKQAFAPKTQINNENKTYKTKKSSKVNSQKDKQIVATCSQKPLNKKHFNKHQQESSEGKKQFNLDQITQTTLDKEIKNFYYKITQATNTKNAKISFTRLQQLQKAALDSALLKSYIEEYKNILEVSPELQDYSLMRQKAQAESNKFVERVFTEKVIASQFAQDDLINTVRSFRNDSNNPNINNNTQKELGVQIKKYKELDISFESVTDGNNILQRLSTIKNAAGNRYNLQAKKAASEAMDELLSDVADAKNGQKYLNLFYNMVNKNKGKIAEMLVDKGLDVSNAVTQCNNNETKQRIEAYIKSDSCLETLTEKGYKIPFAKYINNLDLENLDHNLVNIYNILARKTLEKLNQIALRPNIADRDFSDIEFMINTLNHKLKSTKEFSNKLAEDVADNYINGLLQVKSFLQSPDNSKYQTLSEEEAKTLHKKVIGSFRAKNSAKNMITGQLGRILDSFFNVSVENEERDFVWVSDYDPTVSELEEDFVFLIDPDKVKKIISGRADHIKLTEILADSKNIGGGYFDPNEGAVFPDLEEVDTQTATTDTAENQDAVATANQGMIRKITSHFGSWFGGTKNNNVVVDAQTVKADTAENQDAGDLTDLENNNSELKSDAKEPDNVVENNVDSDPLLNSVLLPKEERKTGELNNLSGSDEWDSSESIIFSNNNPSVEIHA